VTRNVILSGAQRSEESRCESPRPFASLRVTDDSVCMGGSETRPYDPQSHSPPCSPCLRVSSEADDDDEAVEDALYESAMRGSIRAQIFWLVNRAPYKWRPVWRIRVMPRLPSLASMLNVSEPRLREWAYRARSRFSSQRGNLQSRLAARASGPSGHPSPRNVILSGATRSEESRCKISRPFASLRVTGGRVAQVLVPGRGALETSSVPPPSPREETPQSRLGERAPCPPGLPGARAPPRRPASREKCSAHLQARRSSHDGSFFPRKAAAASGSRGSARVAYWRRVR